MTFATTHENFLCRRRWRSGLLATAVLLLVAGCGGQGSHPHQAQPSTHSASPVASAQQLLSSALAAATAKQWVHMDVQTLASGHQIAFSDDDGPSTGIQRITIRGGGAGTVRVLGHDTYMKADATALGGYFGLPADAARRGANRWLLLVPGDSGYTDVTRGVSIGSALQEVTVTSPLRLLPSQTRDGQTVVGVSGGAGPDAPPGATATLWIDPRAGLPVEYVAAASSGDSITSRMSRWGVPVTVPRPGTATSIRQFGG